MEAQSITPEQFRINHLRQQLAEATLKAADASAEAAVNIQVLRQALEGAQARIRELEEQLTEYADEGVKADGADLALVEDGEPDTE